MPIPPNPILPKPISGKPPSIGVQLLDVWLMELTNWRWSWRGMMLTSVVAPILSIVALGSFAQTNPEYFVYVLTGNLVMSLMFSNLDHVASRFTYMRLTGALDYYATLPIHKLILVAAVVFSFFLLSLPALLLTIGFGYLFLKLKLTIHILVSFIIPLSVLSVAGVGAIIGINARNIEESGSLSLLVTMALLFVGPVLIPPDRLPDLMLWIGYFSPATYAADGLRQTLIGPVTANLAIDLVALSGFSLLSFWWVERKLDWRQHE